MGLPAEFVHQVAIIIEHGAIGNHDWRTGRCFKLGRDLCMQDPKLALQRGLRIHGKGRLARDFGDELHVVVRFLQQRTHFVRQSCFAHAMRANQCELQGAAFVRFAICSSIFGGRVKTRMRNVFCASRVY